MPVSWGGNGPGLHLEELVGVVSRTRVEGPRAFRHREILHPVAPVPNGDPEEALVTSLAWHLYQAEYCPGRPPGAHPAPRAAGPAPPEGWAREAGLGDDLGAVLTASDRGRRRWELGWRVERVFSGGGVLASRGPDQRGFLPGTFEVVPPGSPPAPGAALRIRRPPAATPPQPGFHFVEGAALPEPDEGAELIRFYWNVEPTGAPELVALLAAALDRLQVPFRLKVARHAGSFDRADPAILYVHRRFFQAVAAAAAGLRRALDRLLRPATPLFTLPLAPGLALAEDPFTRRSFGLDRCRGLARGLVAARREGAPDDEARLEVVLKVLRERGVDPGRPYLNPGARDVYALPFDWESG